MSEYEATILTRPEVGGGDARRRAVEKENWIGRALVGLSLIAAIGLLHAAASERENGPRATARAPETAVVSLRADAADSGAVVTDSKARGVVKVPLFFGYLEFDWDGEAPGGVHGFGPWPSSPPSTALAAARPVEK